MDGHIIDPTFFYDAIDEFAFKYTIYRKCEADTVDEYGRVQAKYKKDTIFGSFQTQGSRKQHRTSGNIGSEDVNFYCKSLYRINEDDIIKRNDNYYMVHGVTNYDEWGVREVTLTIININEHRNFKEWLEYQTGGITV